jgi:hypothetical protein
LHQISLGAGRLFQRHLAQVKARTAAGVVGQLGKGVGDAAAHVVDGQDGVVLGQAPAVVDDFLRTALDLGLPRCTESKSRSAVLVPAAIDEAAPPPMPMRMPGPPSWTSSVPAGNSIFLVSPHGCPGRPRS